MKESVFAHELRYWVLDVTRGRLDCATNDLEIARKRFWELDADQKVLAENVIGLAKGSGAEEIAEGMTVVSLDHPAGFDALFKLLGG